MPIRLSGATISSGATTSADATSLQKNHLQQLFDGLWRDVKNKQQANARLKIELSDLRKIYHKKILPIEQLSEGPYSQLAQRLIDFFGRKSLAQWQRHELSLWIMECIDTIETFNPEKSGEVKASYQQALATFLQVDIADIEGQMNQGAGSLDELLADVDVFADVFADVDVDVDGIAETSHYFSDSFAGKVAGKVASKFADDLSGHASTNRENKVIEQNLLGDQWLRAIFRRTANALHPDKERDDTLRGEKQELMAQLLAAREEKNVVSLLKMYMQYVDGSDLLITDETMGQLCAQLNKQKKQLADEKQDMLYENPVLAELYKKLHSRSKKKRDKNIERHIQGVQESTQQMLEFIVSLQSLEILKIHLADRYEEYCHGEHAYDEH